jgi:hypothetical protein
MLATRAFLYDPLQLGSGVRPRSSSHDNETSVLPRSYLLACVLFVAAFRSAGAQASSADSVAVSEAHDRWFRGLVAEDTTVLSAVLTSDVTLAFANGVAMSRKNFLQALQSGQLAYDSAEQHSPSTHDSPFPSGSYVATATIAILPCHFRLAASLYRPL